MYDWANSAFYTTVVGALYGPYLTYVAQQSVGPEGVALSLGPLGSISAKSFYPLCITARRDAADLPAAAARRHRRLLEFEEAADGRLLLHGRGRDRADVLRRRRAATCSAGCSSSSPCSASTRPSSSTTLTCRRSRPKTGATKFRAAASRSATSAAGCCCCLNSLFVNAAPRLGTRGDDRRAPLAVFRRASGGAASRSSPS